MTPEQRDAFGIETYEQLQTKVQTYNERKLHKDIQQLLNLKGIVFFEQRMDKRSRGPKGWPDFVFTVHRNGDPTLQPIAKGWECKTGTGKLSSEQVKMIEQMECPPNGWNVTVIRSLQEAIDELKTLGI